MVKLVVMGVAGAGKSTLAKELARAPHFFAPTLVASQFAALEPPLGEPGVLAVAARQPIGEQVAAASAWLGCGAP